MPAEVRPADRTKPLWLARGGVHDRGRIAFRCGGRFHRRWKLQLAKLSGVRPRYRLTIDSKEVSSADTLTVDAADWGEVIKMSGAQYEFGPDPKSK